MMTDHKQLPFRVAELLCSRLCHDLISPVAAVSNGLELLVDEDGSVDSEVAGLVGFSIGQAAGWLTLFRVAYGLGGENADSLTVTDLGVLVDGVIEREKMSFDVPASDVVPGRDASKLSLNMAILGLEALPNRGRLLLDFNAGAGLEIKVTTQADGAALRPETVAALQTGCDPDSLTARSVQGYFTAWLARRFGSALSVSTGPDTVTLSVTLPQ
jgi:histidine phosphotransferase ChpT